METQAAPAAADISRAPPIPGDGISSAGGGSPSGFSSMPPHHLAALRDAPDIGALRAACAAVIRESPHVAVRTDRLEALVPYVAHAVPPGWEWLFDPGSDTVAERLFDAAFNASLNGGYFYRDGSAGAVRQWESGGSGSKALQEWIDGMRRRALLPGRDHMETGNGDPAWRRAIAASLKGVPYADERARVVVQFADPDRRAALEGLAGEVTGHGGLRVALRHVDALARIYPAGLLADPLRKKAILAFLLLAGNMARSGVPVAWEAGFPSDYQLPRGCVWKGVLELSGAIMRTLRDPAALMPVDSAEVFHVRCAAFVAIESLSDLTGVPSWITDGALFMGFRKDPRFGAEAPPPMRVDGTWF